MEKIFKEILKISGTYILVIFLAISIFIVLRINVTYSGPLGDSLGGIFSPLFGIVSVYLLYKAFQLQNDQLVDQRNSNYTQMSFMYLEDIKKMLSNFENENKKYYFKTPINGSSITSEIQEYRGFEAINQFTTYYNSVIGSEIIDSSSFELLRNINAQSEDIAYIHKRIEFLRSKLTHDHHEYCMLLFKRVFSNHIYYSELIYIEIRNILYNIKLQVDEKLGFK